MKRKLSAILAVIFILVVSVSAFAAVQQWTAVKPTYTAKINGDTVQGEELMNISGNTYVRMNLLNKYGIESQWDAVNKIANFTIPQVNDDTDVPPPVEDATESLLNNQKASVRFYNDDNTFLGNGIWIDQDLILTTKTVWSGATKVREYDNNYLVLDTSPVVKESERLIILKSKTKTKYTVKLSNKNPVAGDTSVLIGSIAETPNVINISTVHDYEDFNIFDSGNKEYLRTNNDVNTTSYGSGIYDSNGLLTGIVFYKGANYCICVKLSDIKNIID